MVSVIITCFNEDRKNLHTAINSARMQDVDTEIIVVDGGSDSIVDNDVVVNCDVYIYTTKNIRQSGSVNLGVKNATHDYVLILDADDVLYPEVLGAMIESIHDADVVYGNMTNIFGGEVIKPEGMSEEKIKICNPIFWSSLFRKSAWYDIGGADDICLVDYRVWVKMFVAKKKFKYIDKIIYNHQIRAGSLTDKVRNKMFELDQEARSILYE
jgi:glycosyltransferase involved in cell wall biosynthesis